MTAVRVRAATEDDAAGLAALKEVWADLAEPASDDVRRAFAGELAAWMTAKGSSLIARVAESDGRIVGMAWLVVFDRVPDIHDRSRVTGDVQSVFVLPEHRSQGVGRAMVESLLAAADERGVPRVTVSANEPAADLYLGLGFRLEPYLLERRPAARTAR